MNITFLMGISGLRQTKTALVVNKFPHPLVPWKIPRVDPFLIANGARTYDPAIFCTMDD